jgi:SNF2 family DNA or RNA helicase
MFYSVVHDALIYPTGTPLRILAATEGAQQIMPGFVAVPASLRNVQACADLGLEVTAPMDLDGYDWPIKRPRVPLLHQKITANFLVANRRSFCFNDMGTMKTLSALWAADYLMQQNDAAGKDRMRAIIVSPLSTLRDVWEKEIFQNLIGRRTSVVLHGTADKRRKLLEKDVDFYIINHDGLGVGLSAGRKPTLDGLAKDIAARSDVRLAIVDEAAAYRDAQTRRHRAARALVGQRDYLWLLTGAPTPNGPLDAYGLAKLVNNASGESFTSYRERVMLRLTQFKWLPRAGSALLAHRMLQPSIRYATSDCLDLPPCTVQQREADLSDTQQKALKVLKHEAVLAMQDGSLVHAVNEAALRTKLIQVICGAIYDTEHASHSLDAKPRIDVLREIVEECGEKLIVFAPLTNVLNMLFKDLSRSWPCAIVNGSVKQDERTDIFRRFQRSEDPLRILIADPATMAHGLTLTAATCIVWYGPTDRTELYMQANKRIDRPGQTKATTIVQIVATKIEREIYTRLENNQTLQGVVLQLAREQ